MIVWGDLTNSYEKKISESKGEKERYTHLNGEFHRITRRDKIYYHVRIESPVCVRCWIQHSWGWCTGMTQRDIVGREIIMYNGCLDIKTLFFSFFKNFYFYFILLYNTVLVLPYIDMNPPRVYMSSQTWTTPHLPPHIMSLGHPRAPAPSILYPASNIDWWFVS